jgi:hypothetical protein
MASDETYVHMLFFLVNENNVAKAGPLLEALGEHQQKLASVREFQGQRVLRSPNDKGAVQFIVEQVWEGADVLADYEEAEGNLEQVVRSHGTVVDLKSVQAYDMQLIG